MKFHRVESKQPDNKKDLITGFLRKQVGLADIQCPRDWRRIKGLVEKSVPFIPPTMSPAAADRGELENLEWAIDYYKKNGHKEVTIQEKMMGSRCVVILRREQKPFAISKNGFIINHIDITNELNRLYESELVSTGNDEVILDCELMPWSAMGAGLIEKSFIGYGHLALRQAHAIINSEVEEKLQALDSFLKEEFNSLSKVDFIKKHGHHNYSTITNYRALMANYVDADTTGLNVNNYFNSLDNYIQEYPVQIKPFMYLKRDHEYYVHHPDVCSITFSVDAIERARTFVSTLDKEKTEGVVVKPLNPPRAGHEVPYIKVRNPEYLRIVYGPNYMEPKNLARLISKKNIYYKMTQSRNEWRACDEMLRQGANIENVLCNLLSKPKKEMDPRL